MKQLIDKLIILLISLALFIPNAYHDYMIAPILIAVIASAILSYLEDERMIMAVFAIYVVACFFYPAYLFFLPVICYDAAFLKIKWLWTLSFLPLVTNPIPESLNLMWLTGALILAAIILKYRTVSLQNLAKEYYQLRHGAKEMSLQLEKRNQELLEKQDYEINLATLKERNRIARDIHDNVGHLLSRSILQTGAILAVNRDETIQESLKQVQETLSEAMNSIRASVHDLHEDSIDLKTELRKLVDHFHFCAIQLDYDLESNLEKALKYCFIAVTKEALANIIKHSNASQASVVIREHPGFYQLIIQDNGSQSSFMSETGIGLKNIYDRVTSVHGAINISTDKGFRIFISIPKNKAFKES
ncbi:MAG: sensor histidine kinase [Firmicutes bacterium]|nr:sensor histidine kinase [Bacillota bacterium]